jgi:hypothetical protein
MYLSNNDLREVLLFLVFEIECDANINNLWYKVLFSFRFMMHFHEGKAIVSPAELLYSIRFYYCHHYNGACKFVFLSGVEAAVVKVGECW